VAVCVIASLTLAFLTRAQITVWRDTFSLWEHTARLDPTSDVAQNGYGYSLLTADRLPEAEIHLRQAIALKPRNDKAHFNLWDLLHRENRTADLQREYVEAENIPPQPGHHELAESAHYHHGLLLMHVRDDQNALGHFKAAIELHGPHEAEAHVNCG